VNCEAAMSARTAAPQLMPTLSAGRHRSPKRGACFMEFASYLAGERWSDHPRCTDPTLAALARAVNDTIHDGRRGELVPEIPRVIGLRGDDDRLGLVIALRAATAALPVSSMERQRALAVAVLATLEALALHGLNEPSPRADALRALEATPDAAAWAAAHLAIWQVRAAELVRHGCDAIVRAAAIGIAQACVDDADERLAVMLREAIGDAETFLGRVDEVAPVVVPAISEVLVPAN
jgi:hypothetical protein